MEDSNINIDFVQAGGYNAWQDTTPQDSNADSRIPACQSQESINPAILIRKELD